MSAVDVSAVEFDELAEINATLAAVAPKVRSAPRGFDPAALFLLGLLPDNLFDPADRDGWTFRCKGCGAIVGRTARVPHFNNHKRRVKEDAMPTATKKTEGPKTSQTRSQREAKAAAAKPAVKKPAGKPAEPETPAAEGVPPVEDVTGKEPEPEPPKVKKTQLARDAAFAALKKTGEPMKMKDIVAAIHANPDTADLNKSTIAVQVAAEAKDAAGRFKLVERATYALR